MDAVYPRVAGLDIHKKLIVACRIIPGAGAPVQREVRSFGATTAAIEDLGDWLAEGDVTHVAMEATGVYWKPIFNLLEDRFALVLANAQHIKAVPGRKTDVKDSEWIADLLRHGLVKGSFVPDRAVPAGPAIASYADIGITAVCRWCVTAILDGTSKCMC
jgi:hypothetical protein